MLPCRLPARLPIRLLSEGRRLLFAVEGLEESPVPCLNLNLGAPTDAERFASCSNDFDDWLASGVLVLPLPACFELLFLLLFLFDGKGGNAQS